MSLIALIDLNSAEDQRIHQSKGMAGKPTHLPFGFHFTQLYLGVRSWRLFVLVFGYKSYKNLGGCQFLGGTTLLTTIKWQNKSLKWE